MKNKKYQKDVLEKMVQKSFSYRSVLSKLKIKEAGGNYFTIKKYIRYYNIDTSHFTHQGWNKGKNLGHKRKTEEYLSNKIYIQSHKLKLRLLEEGYFERKCYKCNNTQWAGHNIPLELEHIDGNPLNNNLSNLTLLCPNCHALTPTYRGKNIKRV